MSNGRDGSIRRLTSLGNFIAAVRPMFTGIDRCIRKSAVLPQSIEGVCRHDVQRAEIRLVTESICSHISRAAYFAICAAELGVVELQLHADNGSLSHEQTILLGVVRTSTPSIPLADFSSERLERQSDMPQRLEERTTDEFIPGAIANVRSKRWLRISSCDSRCCIWSRAVPGPGVEQPGEVPRLPRVR